MIGFPAAAFATNCFVVAPAEGERCLIIDPGIGVVDRIESVLTQYRLKPAAVLLTHGHLDHVYSVTPVCTSSGDEGMAAYIHTDDEYRLKNPLELVDPELVTMLQMQFGKLATWKEPDDIRTVADGETLDLAGIQLAVLHAPGHTEGSVMFRVEDLPSQVGADSGLSRSLFAGDVLFAGGIGRTDLPGGSDAAMRASLRDVVLGEQDDSLVLPGHGPATTIGRERVTNPFLFGL